MNLKELIVYFCDDYIHIVNHHQIIHKKLDSIQKGLVVDRTKFMESFLSILKKEKIKSKLFGDKIYIVKDVYFKPSDLFYLESIFSELGFIKIVYIDICDLFCKDYTYIGIFQDYIVFYLEKPLIFDLCYVEDISKLIDDLQEYYLDYVVLFGTNLRIPEIKSDSIHLYYIDHYTDYITESLLKVKKYGV